MKEIEKMKMCKSELCEKKCRVKKLSGIIIFV